MYAIPDDIPYYPACICGFSLTFLLPMTVVCSSYAQSYAANINRPVGLGLCIVLGFCVHVCVVVHCISQFLPRDAL